MADGWSSQRSLCFVDNRPVARVLLRSCFLSCLGWKSRYIAIQNLLLMKRSSRMQLSGMESKVIFVRIRKSVIGGICCVLTLPGARFRRRRCLMQIICSLCRKFPTCQLNAILLALFAMPAVQKDCQIRLLTCRWNLARRGGSIKRDTSCPRMVFSSCSTMSRGS